MAEEEGFPCEENASLDLHQDEVAVLDFDHESFQDMLNDPSILDDDVKDPDYIPGKDLLLSDSSDLESEIDFRPVGTVIVPQNKPCETKPNSQQIDLCTSLNDNSWSPPCKKSKMLLPTTVDPDNVADSDSERSDTIPVQWPELSSSSSPSVLKRAETQNSICIKEKKTPRAGCKQVYDKNNYCPFCSKSYTKISRHILNVHRDEERVKPILFMQKRSKERMAKLELLVNEGNFKHNIKVISDGVGYLVVARRSGSVKKLKYNDFLPCEYCKKFLRRNCLWHHYRQCTVKQFFSGEENNAEDAQKNIRNAVRRGQNLLYSAIMTDEDLLLSKLFSRMNNDCIKDIVFSDNIIKRYSALRIDALGEESDHKINDMHRVSQGARTLARLLKEVKKSHCEIEGFSDLLTPKHFDIVVKTAKEMTFESTSQPLSLARFLGNLLGHAIQVKAGLAIRDNANGKLEEALNFQKLFESEWNCRVNSAAQKKINNLKRNTIQTILLTNDLKTLLEYIKMKMAEKIQSLKDTKKSRDWCDLAALTLCRLIMFNKRRRPEVKDLKVKDYEDRPDWTKQGAEEFEDSMSTTDRIVYKRMDMVISAGKSRKNVDAYVLLPPDGKEAIELLIKTREAVGIPSSNQFIFARLNADTPLNGTQELKQICSLCPGLQYPERINSRNLRKYISTVCQIMDMSEKEVEQLARHLGHDVKTHKEFYRLAHSTVELSKVSQLLMAVERGEVNKWQGKCLNGISIEEFPAFENREDEKVGTSYDSDDATMETATSDDQCRDGILTSTNESECASNINDCEAMETAIPQNSCDDAETNLKDQRKGKKRPWSHAENQLLRENFPLYLNQKVQALHKEDIELVIQRGLTGRTVAQVRTKLNNMKLGKSK